VTGSPAQAERAASLNRRVAAAHRTALTLVLALAMSIVIYVGVGLLILNLRGAKTQGQLPVAFYAAAAALAIGSIVIRRAQFHRMKLEVVAGTLGADGLIKHFVKATIVAAAIAEIIGLLALVAAFLGGDQNDVIRLGVVALAVSLYNYPRRSAWQRAVDYFSTMDA
jgi:F0F1-type ATP synthase membrane subunit c/vacuolar-type H+-ATPase subunit K